MQDLKPFSPDYNKKCFLPWQKATFSFWQVAPKKIFPKKSKSATCCGMKSTRSVVCNHGNAVNVIHRRWYVIKPKKEHTRLAPWCHTVRKANWLHSANADYIPSLRLGCNQNEKADAFASAFSVLVAGKGFEPHDLRVMSPTSYQTALPRDI